MIKRNILTIIFCVLVIGTVAAGFHSWIVTPNDFFAVNISQTITLLSTLLIAFLASQYLNSVRKQKEHIERILLKLQEIVTNESFFHFPVDNDIEEIIKNINMTNRKISNCLGILKKYKKNFKNLNEGIEYLENEFKEYDTDTGENINDLNYLSKSESRYVRISNNIYSKCDYIILLLYK